METRFKKSKALLWVMGGLFLGMVILAIFVHDWSLAVFMGILLVVALILHYLDKDNDLVIDDRGIHQVKGVDYKWYRSCQQARRQLWPPSPSIPVHVSDYCS